MRQYLYVRNDSQVGAIRLRWREDGKVKTTSLEN